MCLCLCTQAPAGCREVCALPPPRQPSLKLKWSQSPENNLSRPSSPEQLSTGYTLGGSGSFCGDYFFLNTEENMCLL